MQGKWKYYLVDGEVQNSRQVAESLGISPAVLRSRLQRGTLTLEEVPSPPRRRKSDHPLYWTHHNMKQRCLNPGDRKYHCYGGRGIKVCDRWLESFENYVSDIESLPEPKEPGMSLDRVDNDGNYEPGNMRWATAKQQRNNQRTSRQSLWITDGQKSQGLRTWARELGVSRTTLKRQLHENRHPFLTLLGRYGELYPETQE